MKELSKSIDHGESKWLFARARFCPGSTLTDNLAEHGQWLGALASKGRRVKARARLPREQGDGVTRGCEIAAKSSGTNERHF